MGPINLSTSAALFLEIKSRTDVASWLDISDRRLRFILHRLTAGEKYTTFEIRKRNGKTRTIEAPSAPLKAIQRRLLSAFEEIAPPSGIAKGFVKDLSIYDHAKRHKSRRWVVLADLSEFFPTINFGRVRGAFLSAPFKLPNEAATVIAQLCCNGKALPQGAPTSPVISNLICRSLDRALVSIARTEKLTVTRYADDICLSTNLPQLPSSIAISEASGQYRPGLSLLKAINNNGFEVNLSKFKVLERRDCQFVTGLVVNRGISTPRRWRRQVRILMSLLERHGEDKAFDIVNSWSKPLWRQGPVKSIEQLLRGKIGYAHWLDGLAGRSFVRSLFRGYPPLRKMLPRLAPSVPFRIMAEGPSDLSHISAALRYFHGQGEFTEIQPKLLNFQGDTNDSELWKTLQRIAKVDADVLTVGLFDCDAPDFLRSNGLEPGAHLRLGRTVYAACLAPPSSSFNSSDPFCIESLYHREDAEREDVNGRRVFFKDEFDEHGMHKSGLYRRQYPLKKSLVLSDAVTRISDGASVLLSKVEFGSLVENRVSPFNDMRFDRFQATLQLLRDVVEEFGHFS